MSTWLRRGKKRAYCRFFPKKIERFGKLWKKETALSTRLEECTQLNAPATSLSQAAAGPTIPASTALGRAAAATRDQAATTGLSTAAALPAPRFPRMRPPAALVSPPPPKANNSCERLLPPEAEPL